ncbi:MAG: PIG-L family deacetylase [Chitinophagaceae bacterium]|nr:PIG-L family deacetylase [Chitinophagaceae bacterium]
MKKPYCILILLVAAISHAQQIPTATSAEIYLGLRKLNVLGSVLYIAAHPDDENTRLLTYFSKERLYRTGYLSLTRGDGGQNLIGDEQGVDLGLIRTQELLAARRIDGAEQFFTRAYDFGYSKSPEETFTKWDKEKILADVVWIIRKFQPDVIITRFPITGEGEHGQHTASAILANEAFTAAADPKRFPEQLKYVQPWQPKRILWNTFNFGNRNTTSADQLKIDVGGFNPLLGKSYGEIAAESRSQHKSQGFGVPRTRGEAIEFFSTTAGEQPAADLFDKVNTTWERVKVSGQVQQLIEGAITSFDFLHPQKSLAQLVNIYKALQALPSGYWRDQKTKEVEKLIEQCSGLWVEAFTPKQFAVQGDSMKINFVLNNRLGAAIKLNNISIDKFDTVINVLLARNKNLTFSEVLFVPLTKEITQPYWLQQPMNEGYYNVQDQRMIGEPDVQPAFTATFNLNIEGENFSFTKPVKFKFTDPVKGELYHPVTVLPPLEVNFVSENYLSINGQPVDVQNHLVFNTRDSFPYQMQYVYSNKWISDRKISSSHLESYSVITMAPAKPNQNIKEEISASAVTDNLKFDKYKRIISYDHIPAITYFPRAKAHLVQLDMKTSGKKIGYIVGAGDKVPEALEQMGYDVSRLSTREIARSSLQHFDAIVTGVRAYNTNEWMSEYYEKLMKYVWDGGNLIVQYNTSNQGGPVRAKIGPYNFNITRNRVTDENAPVTFLKPEHQVLNFPNKITENDFKGWVQERSIYHAADADKNFEKILGMNDPGEKPDDGSLIIAKYGQGYFTYTGLVFFRELPAGVPGAYRLFANLIALNSKKTF